MNAIHQQLAAETQRQFGGQPPSSAGMSPNPSASSPIAPAQPSTAPHPAAPPPAAPNNMTMAKPPMPTQQDPFGGASAAMNGSLPLKGGTALERALVKRMQMYPPA